MVHKENESRVGKDTIDEVYKELGIQAVAPQRQHRDAIAEIPEGAAVAFVKIDEPKSRASDGCARRRTSMTKVLDHLEEWLIASLMGGATILIVVAVIHRYAAGTPIPVVQDWLLKIDLSWAQELCIYMFVWMAKFGAAYGVRTGIHVGVDVMINHLSPRWRKAYVLFGLLAGAFFTAVIGIVRRQFHLEHGAYGPDVARPRAAEMDRLPLHSARLVPDVLPVPSGGRGPSREPVNCRSTTSRTSKGSTLLPARSCTRPVAPSERGHERGSEPAHEPDDALLCHASRSC